VAKAFNAYGDAVFVLNLSLITMPIFLLLFMMAIFETHEYFRTEHRVLQGMLALLVVTFVYGLFDIATALKPANSLAALMMVVTFSVSRCRLLPLISIISKRSMTPMVTM